ncbi:MAG TPA: hypothetical protein VFE82_05855 [Ramlibacter sp.]|jgi:hypothetical protein|uniref:hypothetical protein n=1 Tax=Ramlibacter sp. TaxID=1917967 RepID=UPI002D5F94FE|nr:hypothetical protein [Ramlibacter sp.]HZY17987.1 hypothetical protein [Ramlibacter sp.]
MSDTQEQQRENVPSQPPRDGGERPRQQQQQQQQSPAAIDPSPRRRHPDAPTRAGTSQPS